MKTALLLVDLQGDFLNSAALHPATDPLISQAASLLKGCRENNVPVIHVWTTVYRENDQRLPHWKKNNRWDCLAGSAGHQTPEPLQPIEGETIIHKSGFNGFASGELESILKQLNCERIVIAGVYLHTCVRTAAMESLERGLSVVIADDAIASNDPIYAAATRRWLAKREVSFISTYEILSQFAGNKPSKLIHCSPLDTGKCLFEVGIDGAAEITAASARAKDEGTTWRLTSLTSRAAILENVAKALEAKAPELARQMAIEIGKPISHGLEEIRRAAINIRDVIRRAAAFQFTKQEPAGLVQHKPVGVIALISPWNNPVAIPIGKLAPALIFGNTALWKPAPAATGISKVILGLLKAAGVPERSVQILTGDHTTAQKLAADENVNAVTITSSAASGFAIQEICARRFLPLQAELSGNNAAIVWDADSLADAAKQIVWGAFGFAGQRCTANRRVIVSAEQYEVFWRELKVAAEKLNWGDPLNQDTDIGPMIHARKRDEHTALVAAAQKSGAARQVEFLFSSRAKESWVKTGAYAQPAMVCCDDPAHILVQEETMSPLLVVQRAASFEEALKLCNGVRHGLLAALFSQSPALQKQFIAEAQAGLLKINSTTAGVDVTLPFGGWKMSSLGPPEHGGCDSLFYTKNQTVYK